MKKPLSLPVLYGRHGNGCRESGDEGEHVGFLMINGCGIDEEMDDSTDRVSCMIVRPHKWDTSKRGEGFSAGRLCLWRKQQKTRAARLEKQLRAKWALEELIEEQMARFKAQYNKVWGPTLLKDVAQIIMPEWASPLEMASFGWMGDWRPSSILEVLRSMAWSTSFLLSATSVDLADMDRMLSQLIREIRIEETILQEEMGEILATCILHLPFGPANKSGGPALQKVQSEFKKIEGVISKAQQLRFKALDLIVKKVLNQTDAAEFLVMFAGIQDSVHQFCAHYKLKQVPVSLPTKSLEKDTIWEPSIIRRFTNILEQKKH